MLQRILFPRTFVTLLLELLRQTTFHKKVRKKNKTKEKRKKTRPNNIYQQKKDHTLLE